MYIARMQPTATSCLALILGVSALVFFGSPALATPLYLKFYTGAAGYGGPYNGSNTVYGKTEASGATTLMPSGGTSYNGDVIGSTLTFGSNITATAPNLPNGKTNEVWDDMTPRFGGLGTGLLHAPSDSDQISGLEALTIAFSSLVKLDGVATLFDAPHLTFGTDFKTERSVMHASSTMQFLLSVDGGAFKNYSFLEANEFFNSDISGTTFTFMRDTTSSNPDFYVSALAVEQVPVPGTLALVVSGLGGLGFLRWRRKKKAAVIAA